MPRREREFRDSSVVITGATGFVGSALTKYLVGLNRNEGRGLRIWPVSRSRDETLSRLVDAGDICGVVESDFARELNVDESVHMVFHCATPTSVTMNAVSPDEMFRANVAAMEWITRSPMVLRDTPRVVFTSSGAVYGPQPEHMDRIPETHLGGPDTLNPKSAYAEGKRVAEYMLCEAGSRDILDPVVTRLFAFSGVGLPLESHYAIGNFVNDARRRRPIQVRGTGTATRSYLDVADMVEWLFAAARKAESFAPLHIGSDAPITITGLAELVASRASVVLGHSPNVDIRGETSAIDGADRYVPDTAATRAALGVEQRVTLEESIDRMLRQP